MDQRYQLLFVVFLGLVDKANETADCLENPFTPHDLCDENHERRVEAGVQAMLETVDNNPRNNTYLLHGAGYYLKS
jgi:hypothetical protein